jgi:hypothetical protein
VSERKNIVFEVTLPAYHNVLGKPAKIVMDGRDISNYVDQINIHADINEMTKVTVRFLNVDVVGIVETADTNAPSGT